MQAEIHIEKISHSLSTLRRRIFVGVALSSFVWAIIPCNMLLGMAVIVGARLGFPLSVFMTCVSGFLLAGAYAIIKACRLMLDDSQGLAILDAHNGAGGLILSVVETKDSSWSNRLPEQIIAPDVKVNYHHILPLFAGSVIFVILAFYTPVFTPDPSSIATLDFNQLAGHAREAITVFEETGMLTAEEAQMMDEQLSAINQAADSHDPSKTFEALDQMAQKLQLLKQTGANSFKDNLEQLERSLKAIEGMQDHAADSVHKLQAAQSLMQQMKNLDLLSDNKQMMKALNALQEAMSGATEENNLEQAVKDLKNYIENEREKTLQNMQKLVEAQVIDAETMQQITDQAGQEDGGDGQITIMSPSDGDEMQPSGKAGKSEPWMTAPLDSNRVTSEHSMKYKDDPLPIPGVDALETAVVTGTAISAPLAESVDFQTGFNQPEWNSSQRSMAETNMLLPRHRNTVINYFNRSRNRSKQ